MGKILENLHKSFGLAIGLAILVFLILHAGRISLDTAFWSFVFRWLHVISGVLWIGLLWYLNIVQVPTMPKIPAELKPAVSKYIAPEVLFWFRYSALATIITGLILAMLNGYLIEALTLRTTTIGIGMWLGLIMAFNVWFLIWPNQKKVLGLVPADDAEKASAGRVALMASRTNFALSLPMLYCMVAFQNLG